MSENPTDQGQSPPSASGWFSAPSVQRAAVVLVVVIALVLSLACAFPQ
jgi:hypothetical protein